MAVNTYINVTTYLMPLYFKGLTVCYGISNAGGTFERSLKFKKNKIAFQLKARTTAHKCVYLVTFK